MSKTEKKDRKIVKVKAASPWKLAMRRLRKNKLAMFGLGVLIFMFLFSFVGPLISPLDGNALDFTNTKKPPSLNHIFGTDMLGRDIFTRLMYAGRVSLMVGVISVSIQVIIGGTLGSIAGYYGGWVDTIIMRIVDIFLCVPSMPILIILGAILSDAKVPPNIRIIFLMFIIGFLSWPSMARLVRGQILSLREQEFMQAADALGLKDSRKIFKHLLPNVVPQIIVTVTLSIGYSIMTESALSYLGMGVTPPQASWGNMIQAVNNFIDLMTRPWLWIPPGVCIFLTVMSINLLGDGLRDALDPKMKK